MKKSSPARLKDVASAAGVSVSTASRVLSGKAAAYRISQATQAAVQKAAGRLEFRPSQVARSLRLQKTNTIGVVVPDMANPFFAAIAREITIAAEASGRVVLMADCRDTTEHELSCVQQLLARQVEGLLVCPVGRTDAHLAEVAEAGLPLVLVDRVFENRQFVSVTSGHCEGAGEVVDLLLACGHRTIGVLQGLPETLPNEERIKGYRDSLRRRRIAFEPSLIRGENFSAASGYEACKSLLEERPDVTALFAFSNQNAFGALKALQELGRCVPDDVSLVTFDDHPLFDHLAVPLTAASQDAQALGSTAAQLLIKQIESGRCPREKQHRVPIRLIKRSSVGTPAITCGGR
jgi:LacI family transcriptional regulator, galactose operon repressor